MTIEQCPFCGSKNLTSHSEQRKVTVPYGPSVSYESPSFVCANCNEETSLDEEAYEAARSEAVVQSVRMMLEDLKRDGISTAYLERALRLSQRTAARWKGGNFSAAAVALLRCIRTFPRLLDIADDDFRVPSDLEPRLTTSGASLYRALSKSAISTGTSSSPPVELKLVP